MVVAMEVFIHWAKRAASQFLGPNFGLDVGTVEIKLLPGASVSDVEAMSR
jgi:hypothetical protein